MKSSLLILFLAGALLGACRVAHLGATFPGEGVCGAVESCESACSASDAHACGVLAEGALFGAGMARSAEKAVAYATRGCDGHDGRSCQLLATLYFKGVGVPKDWTRANAYAETGCTGGWAVSCSFLGVSYRDGLGVPRDAARAEALFARSCDGGSALGCLQIAVGAPDGMVPEDRAARALPLLVHDCDPTQNPDPRVCRVAGKMYANGRGAPRDAGRARDLYDAACTRGDPVSCDERKALR